MTLFKNYDQNGKLVGVVETPLDKSNVLRYREEHGQSRLDGYVDAFKDFLKEIETIIYCDHPQNMHHYSAAIIRRNLLQLHQNKTDFLASTTLIEATKSASDSIEPVAP